MYLLDKKLLYFAREYSIINLEKYERRQFYAGKRVLYAE
jgi:hypothetical protein